MSILGEQIKELREAARQFEGYQNGEISRMMREAAYTIESLRDRLQAATLGSEPPYDELLRCLENDWHIRASWDGLRKFWCVELTEEGVKLRDAVHGTLTAEQVREAVMSADRWEKPMSNTGLTNTHLIIRDDGWQAIADELNALSERTCKCVAEHVCSPFDGKTIVLHRCSVCHELMRPYMKYCPCCGAKVVDNG